MKKLIKSGLVLILLLFLVGATVSSCGTSRNALKDCGCPNRI